MSKIQNPDNYQMLAVMWVSRNSHFDGKANPCPAALGDSSVVPCKDKHRLTISNTFSLPKWTENLHPHKNQHTIVALFITQKLGAAKMSFKVNSISIQWTVTQQKRNQLSSHNKDSEKPLMHIDDWNKTKNKVLKGCMIPTIWCSGKNQTIETIFKVSCF